MLDVEIGGVSGEPCAILWTFRSTYPLSSNSTAHHHPAPSLLPAFPCTIFRPLENVNIVERRVHYSSSTHSRVSPAFSIACTTWRATMPSFSRQKPASREKDFLSWSRSQGMDVFLSPLVCCGLLWLPRNLGSSTWAIVCSVALWIPLYYAAHWSLETTIICRCRIKFET